MFKIAQHYLYTKHATKMISEFLGKLKKVKQGVGVGVGNPKGTYEQNYTL